MRLGLTHPHARGRNKNRGGTHADLASYRWRLGRVVERPGRLEEVVEEEEEELSLSARAWGCWMSDSLWVGPPVSRAP
jgi:hypothetical protein